MRDIMDEYGGYLTNLSFMYVKNWATAEDIVQESFIKFFKKPLQFEGRASLKTYLSKIVIHASTDYLRSWKSRKNTWTKFFIHTKVEQIDSVDQSVLMEIEQTELLKHVFDLSLKYREVITLFYYEDMTSYEISQLLMIPESTVKTRLKRAREQLKAKLTEVDWEVLRYE